MAKEEQKKTKRPTAEKRLIQSEKRRQINKNFKSKMRTAVRRFHTALKGGDVAAVTVALNDVYSCLDKAVKRGIVKLNKASRDKARLAAKAAQVAS